MYNHTGLQGRLTADPELRYTQQGTAITSFTLASDTGRKTKDGKKITNFIECVAWRAQAEFVCKYRQTAQPRALLRRVQHRYAHRAGDGGTLLRRGFFPDVQLPAGADDPRHVRAVFRDGGLHRLLVADRRVTCLFPTGQVCEL